MKWKEDWLQRMIQRAIRCGNSKAVERLIKQHSDCLRQMAAKA
jgi:hypothetical protein